MAKYTTTIRHLMDNNFDFGLTSYDIFDEDYRSTLNAEILNYYYMYEIGFEVPNLFKHYLNSRMQLIMPKYNVLYRLQKDELLNHPFANVGLTETMDKDTTRNDTNKDEATQNASDSRSTDTTANGESSQNTTHNKLFQDTPQGQLDKTAMEDQTWATNLTQDKDNLSNSGSSESSVDEKGSNTSNLTANSSLARTGTEDYVKKVVGYNGKWLLIDIYLKYVNNFRNIDQQIIEELQDLFMGVL